MKGVTQVKSHMLVHFVVEHLQEEISKEIMKGFIQMKGHIPVDFVASNLNNHSID